MYPRIRITALALSLAALPALASAQAAKPLSFGVSGGLSLPTGDFGDAYHSGFNVSGHVYYVPATMPNLSLRGDVTYDRFGGKDDVFNRDNATFRSLGFIGNAMYALGMGGEGSVRPYVIAGLGFYNGDTDLGETDETDSSTDFGFNAGAGINFALSGFQTFAEVRYHRVDETGWLPVTFGIRF